MATNLAIYDHDFLICSVAVRREMPILTSDRDFDSFAKKLPIILHRF